MRDIRNYSLLQHNTFGIDARCSRFLEYGNEEEACEVAAILRQEQQPFIIIGEGSNLLLTGDYDGIVVHSVVKGIQSGDFAPSGHEFFISAGSGETFDDLICWALNHNMPELVNLSLIPGEVGASAVQNIGAYGVEVGQYIDYIYAIDIATGERRIILGKDCGYGYRQSRFKREWKNRYLILSVTYQLSTNYKPCLDYGNIRSELERRGIIRREHGYAVFGGHDDMNNRLAVNYEEKRLIARAAAALVSAGETVSLRVSMHSQKFTTWLTLL